MLQSFKIIILSLITSFTILFPISSYIAINLLENNPDKIKTENKNPELKYAITKKQDITILLIISDDKMNLDEDNVLKQKDNNNNYYMSEKKDVREKFLVLKISPYDHKICLTDIPKDLTSVCQTNEGTPIFNGNLEEIYNFGGANFLKNTIENLTRIEINNIIKINKNAIDTITSTLGGIKSYPKNKTYYKIVSNEEFYKKLKENPKDAITQLKNNFNTKTNLSNFFSNLSNLSYTDITLYDFKNRKKAFEEMLEKQRVNFMYINIETQEKNKIKKISEETLQKIKETFK